jgi:TatD DNase family protein
LPAVGIHPENIDNSNLKTIENIIKEHKVFAIGEIGLDYHYNDENKDEQKEYFIKQLDLALKYDLPVIIHIREAMQECFDILKTRKNKGIIHCFSGSVEMAREYIKLGYKLGIGGVLTFKNSKLYEVIEKIDLKDIVLETDSPFLSPEPFRGKKNKPCNVLYVAKRIAEIKNISLEEVINTTTATAKQIFDI